MRFIPLDMASYPRREVFMYFSKMAPTGYSITVNADVTKLKRTLKEQGIKFFPVYLWLVTKNLNSQIEFRLAESDGQIGYYDTLTPLYAHFHDDDKTFSLMWTEYSDDFTDFYGRYLENVRLNGERHGVLGRPGLPPPNAYTVSCIPWVKFEHFAVHSYENKPYYFPSVEAGRIFSEGDKELLPLSLTCHHAATDGYHISRFLEELQVDMDSFSV
ncbi:MAG: chloramphenicol acetyltransferase CAT [Oscillospiraceae bacterium]|nr:chloramphenicol acetyltransferase CAT [Oscillospiraceae bacterium]